MSQADLFGRRAVMALVVVALLSMSLAAVLALDSPTPPNEAPVPSTSSRAATGHRALLAFLRALGYAVRATPVASDEESVLLIIEPELELARPDTGQRLQQHVSGADRVLVVLPKWKGEGNPEHPGWLAQVQPLSAADVAVGLSALGISGSIERRGGTVRLHSLVSEGEAEIENPQFLSSPDLKPLVSGPEGVLVAEFEDDEQVLIIVSDPDLFSNHGLRRGGNAAIVAGLFDRLTEGAKGRVVLDESLIPHGHRSFLSGLFHFPTVLAVLQLLVCLGLCVWAGLVRFGAPLPEEEIGPRGATALIEGAVALQLRAGRPFVALYSLLEAAVRDVSERLHAPSGLTSSGLDLWFERRAVAFGHRETLSALRQQVINACDTRKVLSAAQAVQRWRKRMVHGTR